LPTKNWPIGAFTDTTAFTLVSALICPGTATGVAGVGKPADTPPDVVNPAGPAKTPTPAVTLDSAFNHVCMN